MPPPSQLSTETLSALVEKAASTPPGPFVEVGVFQGGSAWYLAKLAQEQGREIWLYDTFSGIPYSGPHDSHKIGDFSQCSYDEVREAIPYAKVVQGIYPASAYGARWGPTAPISFVHMDCDQEKAYKDSIDYLIPKMAKGGVMWFDDAPCLPGATKVCREYFGDRLHTTLEKWWVEF
jgi:predicted O-methyltransferase YrrM